MMNYINKLLESPKKYFGLQSSTIKNNVADNDTDKIKIQDTKLICNDPPSLSISTEISNVPSKIMSIDETVAHMQPTVPLFCIRPKTIKEAANYFVSEFPGQVLYAVKSNSEPKILELLWEGGIRHFDCASTKEIQTVRALLPSAGIHFMHPVKSKEAIYKAYFNYNVRDFAIDSLEELHKIKEVTGNADDLGILVRIQVAENVALHDLSRKYGASETDTIVILREARPFVKQLGICLHVGSQCLEPLCYENALSVVKEIITEANVKIDIIDIGGGFPGAYVNCIPPTLDQFFLSIKRGYQDLNMPEGTALWCEPGRALVCAGCSVVVQVLACRGDDIYINDGAYGCLGDAGPLLNNRFPVRLMRQNELIKKTEQDEENKEKKVDTDLRGYQFYGPTCDSLDLMEGPFDLPGDVKTGDYIEVGQIGAYSIALKTPFNGYDDIIIVLVNDEPLSITDT